MMGDGSDDGFSSRDGFLVDSYGALGVPDFKSQGNKKENDFLGFLETFPAGSH